MVPLWVKIAASNLVIVPEVETLKITNHILEVQYTTGITEGYRFALGGKRFPHEKAIVKEDLIITGKARLQKSRRGHDFVANRSLYDYHYRLRLKEATNWSFIDRRILIHRFGLILGQGGVHEYPPQEIAQHIERLQALGTASIPQWNYGYWHKLWMYYFCPDRNVPVRKCVRIIDWKLRKKGYVDSSLILSIMMRRKHKRHVCHPAFYAGLFSKLGVERVLDLHPQTGSKAIACALLGIEYASTPSVEMDYALNRGIIEDFGLKYEPYDKDAKYDLLISDNNFKDYQVKAAKPFAHQARRFMAFSDGHDKEELLKHNPKVIKLDQSGHFLLW